MKKAPLLLLASSFCFWNIPVFADLGQTQTFPIPHLVKIMSDEIFVPPGFDDNDNAQIVMQSTLANTCYKAATPQVKIDRTNKIIRVSMQAYHSSSPLCLEVLTPLTQTVDLGVLQAGSYQIFETDSSGKRQHETALPIAIGSGQGPDDVLYAPVKEARLDNTGSEGTGRILIISGVFRSECMTLGEVKVLHRVPHIIEVLPLAHYRSQGACLQNMQPFEERVTLPQTEPGDTLIHVRSLNGQAVNQVVSDPLQSLR